MPQFVHGKSKTLAPGKLLNEQGFTLVEVLVAAVILTLVVHTAAALLMTGLTSYLRYSEESDVRSQLRIGMNRLERELREARWLTTTTDTHVLKFRMPKPMTDSNPAMPTLYARDKIIAYYVKDGDLLRKIYDIPSGFDGQMPNRGEPLYHPNEGVNTIARNIQSLKLTYLPTETPDNSYKTMVIITLEGQGRLTQPPLLTSAVQLRSPKDW
ncbi:hypothetical protein JCM39194_00560 [Desulfotomaculum varum]